MRRSVRCLLLLRCELDFFLLKCWWKKAICSRGPNQTGGESAGKVGTEIAGAAQHLGVWRRTHCDTRHSQHIGQGHIMDEDIR